MDRKDIDMLSIGRGLWRSLPTLLALSLVAGLLTFAGMSLIKPRFTSEARVTIAANSGQASSSTQEGTASLNGPLSRPDKKTVGAHIKALQAPDLLLRVAQQLKLSQHPEFNVDAKPGGFASLLRVAGLAKPAAKRTLNEDELVKAMARQLRIVPISDGRLIAVRYSAYEPALAANVTNQLVGLYLQNIVEQNVAARRTFVAELAPKITQLKGELADTKAAIERLRERKGEIGVGGQGGSKTSNRLATLSANLIRLEKARSSAESKWRAALERSSRGQLGDIPEVKASPVVQPLLNERKSAERRLAKAGPKLAPSSPRLAQLKTKLAAINNSIRDEVRRIIRGLEKEFRTAAFRVQDTKTEISRLKPQTAESPDISARLKSLETSAQTAQAELNRLQRQLDDNNAAIESRNVAIAVQLVTRARPSNVPTSPRKVPYTLLVMMAMMILGLAVAAAREIIAAGRSPQPAQPLHVTPETSQANAVEKESASANEAAEQPNLLQWPQRGQAAEPAEDPDVADAGAAAMSSSGIARHLLARGEEVAGFRTIIVGERHGIDPADEGMNLARELSKAGAQVIVLDWNLDHEGFSNVVGLANRPGITELLSGNATFGDIITNIPSTRIHHIGMGPGFEKGEADYDGDDLNTVLDALDEAYDQILVIGRYNTAQTLFEAIEGRFDAGITVYEPRQSSAPIQEPEDCFLGFEVTDIDIIHYERAKPTAFAARRAQIAGGELRSA